MSDYHGRLMNLRTTGRRSVAYREGHRDARHAAAEIANEADAEIARLRETEEALRKIKAGERHVHDGEEYVILLSAERCRDIAVAALGGSA
jgi:hypothetical protein